jgi:hypothetical protein
MHRVAPSKACHPEPSQAGTVAGLRTEKRGPGHRAAGPRLVVHRFRPKRPMFRQTPGRHPTRPGAERPTRSVRLQPRSAAALSRPAPPVGNRPCRRWPATRPATAAALPDKRPEWSVGDPGCVLRDQPVRFKALCQLVKDPAGMFTGVLDEPLRGLHPPANHAGKEKAGHVGLE